MDENEPIPESMTNSYGRTAKIVNRLEALEFPKMVPDFQTWKFWSQAPIRFYEWMSEFIFFRKSVSDIHVQNPDIRYILVAHFKSICFKFMESWFSFLEVQAESRSNILYANMLLIASVFLHNLIAQCYLFRLIGDSFTRNSKKGNICAV